MDNPIGRTADIVIQELEDETLIYDLSNHKAFCLNHTSALVFQFCNGKNSVTRIKNLLRKELKTEVSEDFVYLALSELKKNNLLKSELNANDHFDGLSRREIVKRVGLTSLIALPIISSMVAPNAAIAASCIPFSNPCVPAPNRCCPGSICSGLGTCGCSCSSPGDCLSQTSCPSTVNCNASRVCAP